MGKQLTLAQQYAAIRRVLVYDKTETFDYAACDIETRYNITMLIPRVAKACGNSQLEMYASIIAEDAKQKGV